MFKDMIKEKLVEFLSNRPHILWELLGMKLKVAQFDQDRMFNAPTQASEEAAGYDFYTTDRLIIEPGGEVEVLTNVAMEIPRGWCGKFYPRGGLGREYKVRFDNTTPIIDSDYRGQVKLTISVPSTAEKTLSLGPGERFCQMVLSPAPKVPVLVVQLEELSNTKRGEDGGSSTGFS